MLHIIEQLTEKRSAMHDKRMWQELDRVYSDNEWRNRLEQYRAQGKTVRSVHQDSERSIKCPACGMRGNLQTDPAHALFYWHDDEKYDGLTGFRIPKHVTRRDHCETCPKWGQGRPPKKYGRQGTYGQPVEPVSQPVAPATVPEDQLAAAVEAAIAERFGSQLQAMEQKLEQAASQAAEQAAREAMQGRTVTRVEIHDRKTGTIRPLEEATHFVVPKIVQALQAGCNVWLVGPTGTGKTHIAIQVAKIMGLDFEGISLTTGTPVSEIKGYRDANGNFQDTGYFRVFTKGGLILLDEADNGHPNTLGVGNQGFSNGVMSFPDGQMHTRHEEAYCLTSANTAGTGADSQYSGRNKLDAAFLKRFVHIDVPIDLALEEHVTRSLVNNQDLASWSLQAVREVRAASERLKLPITFSPRECYDTAKLLQAGFTKDDVARMSIRKDVSPDDWAKVTPGTILDGLGKTVSSR